tara:strand:- start:2686 stop:3135 length:450 start_codon:yes stop_codon:yes gene_type:complete
MKIIYLIIFIITNSYSFSDEKIDSYFFIDSDQLIISDNLLVSEFIGNAYARNETNHFWGDKILIDYDKNKKIKLITIIQNVKIKRLNEEIFGNRAQYNPKLEKIKINGNVKLIKDGNILSGDELTIDLITSISIIKGNTNNQVSAKVIE